MKNIKPLLITYTKIITLFFALYLLLLHLPIFSQMRILFYRGLLILSCETLIFGLVGSHVMRKQKLSLETFVAALALGASLSIVFLTIFPVTVDRSISTYLLSTINSQNHQCAAGGVTKDHLRESFIKEYVNSADAIGRRLDEQRLTGSIYESSKGCWSMTPRGKRLLSFFNVVKKYFTSSYAF